MRKNWRVEGEVPDLLALGEGPNANKNGFFFFFSPLNTWQTAKISQSIKLGGV